MKPYRPWRAMLLVSVVLLYVAVIPLGAQDPPPTDDQPKKPVIKNDKPRQRARFFYEQRSTAAGTVPGALRLQAFQRLEEMRRKEQGVFSESKLGNERFSIGTSATAWTPVGPRPTETGSAVGAVSGRTAAVAVNPLNSEEIYAAGAQGGLWRSVDGGNTWQPLTDFEESLAGGAIALDVASCSAAPGPVCQTIYFATGEQTFSLGSYYGAGILKSVDGGASWNQLRGDPVGGGAPFFSGPLSISTGGARISSLVIQPGTSASTAVLLAGVQVFVGVAGGASSGIYRSTDAGQTWAQVLSGAAGTEVAFDPANPSIAWAALGTDSIGSGASTTSDPENGIYKSTNGGAAWTKQTLPAPATAANLGRIEIAVGPPLPPSAEGVVYASIADATNDSDSVLAVMRTVNGGTTWTHLNAGTATNHCNPQCWYDHVIRVHPNNPNVAYMGGSAVGGSSGGYFQRTIDGGSTWLPSGIGAAGTQVHVDIQSLAFSFVGSQASHLVMGNDGGVWRADVSNALVPGSSALNWVNLNRDLQTMQFYPGLSFHPATPDIGFGGAQDNGTHKYTGALQWTDVTCGDGGWTAVDPLNPDNVYATCQLIDVRRSTTGGGPSSFSVIDNNSSNSAIVPITQSDRVAFIPPFVMDPTNAARLYFGTFRLWTTANANGAAPAWLAVSPDLTAGAGTIRAIAVAPSNPDVVYVGTSDGRVQRTTNATALNQPGGTSAATWTNITGQGLPPTRAVTWLTVHPTNSDIVYVTFSGFSRPAGNGDTTLFPDNVGHVFRLDLAQAIVTWTDISGQLPNVPANVLVIDPANTNRAFLGTDVGVFISHDVNAVQPSWSTLVTGLPRVAVLGLAMHGPSRTLRAATHGRGMWDLLVPVNSTYLVSSLNPNNADVGTPGITLTVNGTGFTGNSIVRWNGGNRPTTFISGAQLTAAIPAADLASTGSAQVTVFDPAPNLGASNSLTFTVRPQVPPNDNFAQAMDITASPFSHTLDTTNATGEQGDPTPNTTCVSGIAGSGRSRTVWYRFTPHANGTVSVDTSGSAFDTVLTLWSGSALGALSEVACDDDSGPGTTSLLTNVAVNAGTTYHLMVGGFSSTSFGALSVNFSTAAPLNQGPIGFVDGAGNSINGAASVAQGGTLVVSGWAADPEGGAPVTRVEVRLDGVALGNATLGGSRPDVAAGFGRPDFANSGWSLQAQLGSTTLGTKTITAIGFDALGTATALLGPKTINVFANAAPIGVVDLARDLADGDSTIVQGGTLRVSGWAADPEGGAPVNQVQILVDGLVVGSAVLNVARPDVASGFGRPDFANSGWTFNLSNLGLSGGVHNVTALAIDAFGASAPLGGSHPVTVLASQPPFGFVDGAVDAFDLDGSAAQGGTFQVHGWAADPESGSPVARVEVRVDGLTVGNAVLGAARPDVAAGFGRPDFANSGWTFTAPVGSLTPGLHTVTAVAFDQFNNSSPLGTPRQLNVQTNVLPIGVLDSALDVRTNDHNIPQGATLMVRGWAADPEGGAPVNQVEVLVDGLVVGLATLGSPRPDVATGFGRPDFASSGWSLTIPSVNLTLGSHTVTAIARDSLGGSAQLTSPKVIVVKPNNPPFGFIDAAFDQADGDTTVPAGGTLTVTGWAADDETGTPIQRVEIRIDGVAVGNATLGSARPDVAAGFGRPDFASAGWTFTLAGVTLSTGNHTITAVAFDAYGGSAALNAPKVITTP